MLPASVGEGITPDSYGLNMMHFIPRRWCNYENMQLLKEWIDIGKSAKVRSKDHKLDNVKRKKT